MMRSAKSAGKPEMMLGNIKLYPDKAGRMVWWESDYNLARE